MEKVQTNALAGKVQSMRKVLKRVPSVLESEAVTQERTYVELANVISTGLNGVSLLTNSNRKPLQTITDRIKLLEIDKPMLISALTYIKLFKSDSKGLVDLHDRVRLMLTGENNFREKTTLIPLDADNLDVTYESSIDQLRELSNKFTYFIETECSVPVTSVTSIAKMHADNNNLETESFKESSFLGFNQIIYEHSSLKVTADMVRKMEELYEDSLVPIMLEYPQRIVDANKLTVASFGIISDMISDFRFENIFESDETLEAFADMLLTGEWNDNVLKNPSELRIREAAVEQAEESDSELEAITKIQDKLEAFFERSKKENTQGIIDPRFQLMNGLIEINQYERYDNVNEMLDKIINHAIMEKNNNIIANIQQQLQVINNPNRKIKYEKLSFQTFSNIFKDIVKPADFMELVEARQSEIKLEHEFNTMTLLAPIPEDVKPTLVKLLTTVIDGCHISDVTVKSVMVSIISVGIEQQLSSWINLIQIVQTLENALVSGPIAMGAYNDLSNYIQDTTVEVSVDLGDTEGNSYNRTETMPILDIFRKSYDINNLEVKVETCKTINKIFQI